MDFVSTLLSWIGSVWDYITPFFVINDYEEAVVMRFGRAHRDLKSGFHWKWPLAETVLTVFTSVETFSTKPQCVITHDGVSVLIEGAVKGKVEDARTHLIMVRDVENAISDIAQGIIKKEVSCRTFKACFEEDLDNEIAKKLRREAKKFGVSVESVILTTFDRVRSMRIMNQ